MSCDLEVSQTANFGAHGNTFIAEQNNGLSVADATQIAFSIFREYYPQLREELLQDLRKLLEQELRDVPPENIVPPTPRIAVPALQNASITEEPEIRKLYAKLLANSMNSVVKDGVHPGFVEIVKQLSPDEAKILAYMRYHTRVPTITLVYTDDKESGISVVTDFTDVTFRTNCEKPYDWLKYIDNLVRLGLLKRSTLSSLTDKSVYEPLKNHPYIVPRCDDEPIRKSGFQKYRLDEGYVDLTAYGIGFCNICL